MQEWVEEKWTVISRTMGRIVGVIDSEKDSNLKTGGYACKS
jgi:hypothetical protein